MLNFLNEPRVFPRFHLAFFLKMKVGANNMTLKWSDKAPNGNHMVLCRIAGMYPQKSEGIIIKNKEGDDCIFLW